jgi:hypothetical protein
MLHKRGDHQFETTPASLIDQAPSQGLDLKSLRRQHVCNVFGQQPGSGHETGNNVNRGL